MKTKNLLAILSFILGIGVLYSFTTQTIITDSTLSVSQEGEWKNLTVLPQNISSDSLKGLMKGYNKALGVKCNYCHTEIPGSDKLNFPDDSKKEKEYARHMISMTHQINATHFNWENATDPNKINVVTCAMCHRGNPNPTKVLQ